MWANNFDKNTCRMGLENFDVLVSKIGGDNAGEILNNMELLEGDLKSGVKNVLIFSAIRSSNSQYKDFAHQNRLSANEEGFNTTSHLLELSNFLKIGNFEAADVVINSIESFLNELVGEELKNFPNLKKTALSVTASEINVLRELLLSFQTKDISTKIFSFGPDRVVSVDGNISSVTAWGENLSQKIYGKLLPENSSEELSLSSFDQFGNFSLDENSFVGKNGSNYLNQLKQNTKEQLRVGLSRNETLVAGGYLPILAMSRGYSDKIGTMVASVISSIDYKPAYLIEKQFAIKSADPRKINDPSSARIINAMSYPFASELFGVKGANAGAVNPESLSILKEANVPAFVLDPTNLSEVTQIGGDLDVGVGVENVSERSCQAIVKISGKKMAESGVIQIITDWLAENNIAFDHSASSENSLSFTFQDGMDDVAFKKLQSHLELNHDDQGFELSVDRDKSLLFVLGNNISDADNFVKTYQVLAENNVSMSFSSVNSKNSIVVAVPKEKVSKILNDVHEKLIEDCVMV